MVKTDHLLVKFDYLLVKFDHTLVKLFNHISLGAKLTQLLVNLTKALLEGTLGANAPVRTFPAVTLTQLLKYSGLTNEPEYKNPEI